MVWNWKEMVNVPKRECLDGANEEERLGEFAECTTCENMYSTSIVKYLILLRRIERYQISVFECMGGDGNTPIQLSSRRLQKLSKVSNNVQLGSLLPFRFSCITAFWHNLSRLQTCGPATFSGCASLLNLTN